MLKKNWIFVGLFLLLIYTRFVGINWGLPYPMHPDERNMVNATQQLRCDVKCPSFPSESEGSADRQMSNVKCFSECLNPNFFAYGQLPLYTAFFFLRAVQFATGTFGNPLSFDSVALVLRIISAFCSIATFFVALRIINLIRPLRYLQIIASSLILILVPYPIQFARFGTTESFLMFLYSAILYLTLKIVNEKFSFRRLSFLGILLGISIGVKVSSVLFAAGPMLVIFFHILFLKEKIIKKFASLLKAALVVLLFSAVFAVVSSVHNLISLPDFIGALRYEKDVAVGAYKAFYTRQFEDSVPFVFQLGKVFPNILGWPQYILFIFGFFFFRLKDRNLNIVRLFILLYFIPSALVYAKWTRFVSPIFPMMSIIIAILVIDKVNFLTKLKGKIKNVKSQVKSQKFVFWIINIFCISLFLLVLLPGAAYLSVYVTPDVRFKASDWIYDNIPQNSLILSETANVVDIPMPHQSQTSAAKNYQVISFDFYNLDTEPILLQRLEQYLQTADYIFIPSRRIFANHTCLHPDEMWNSFRTGYKKDSCEKLREQYPLLNQYYQDLFSGASGFVPVAKITSFPKISFLGITFFEIDDEWAEETWTVFDHPVVRIYKRI